MENIKIKATDRSPEVDFNFGTNTFTLRGESYPEDVNAFFGRLVESLEGHLSSLEEAEVLFNFELVYFNSSSAKILMGLFELLEETAKKGSKVHVVWSYEEDDDNMEELGNEFCEDLENATYELRAFEG